MKMSEISHKKETTKEQIKHLLNTVLYNSLAQAIIKIIQTPHWILKLFLFIFVIVSSGLASYMVINSILTYLSYNVVTTSRTIYETPTEFPAITFCNSYMFTTEYAFKFIQRINEELSPNISIFNEAQFQSLNFAEKKYLINMIFNAALEKVNAKNFPDIERKKMGHEIKDIVILCAFNTVKCDLNQDFTWFFDKIYGNCFTYNSGLNTTTGRIESANLKKSSVNGWLYGLKIQLYVNYYANLTVLNSYGKYYYNKFNSYGAIISIDNSTKILERIFNGYTQLTAGMQSNVKIDRTFSYYLPKPYSSCDLDNDSSSSSTRKTLSHLINLFIDASFGYKQNSCIYQCYQFEMVKNCNCTDPNFFSLINSTRTCTSQNDLDCWDKVWFNVIQSNNFIKDNCIPLCPLECNRTEYNVQLSTLELTGDTFYPDLIRENPIIFNDFLNESNLIIKSGKAIKSFVVLNAFYDSLSYTLSTESPQMDIVSLFACIGGNLSLFLGISVFSFFELIQVLIEIYFIKNKN
jgi:hypothetical protein